jgi:outer membrane lipoprotein carrier protein
MKFIIFITSFFICLYADLSSVNSFEADFSQVVQDENNQTLTYKGHIIATKPQYALWEYKTPIEKNIYISRYRLTVIEPEIEQVIKKSISSEFDFFKMLQHATKIDDTTYTTQLQNTLYKITLVDQNSIESISYKDNFENSVKITFSNQKINQKIDTKRFIPNIPIDFDIINE